MKRSWLRGSGWTRRGFLTWSTIAFAVIASGPWTKRAASTSVTDEAEPLTAREQAILIALIAQVVPLEGEASTVSRVPLQAFTKITGWIGRSSERLMLYRRGLDQIDAVSRKRYGVGFRESTWAQQFELLSWLDGATDYYAKGTAVAGRLPALKNWLSAHLPIRTLKTIFLHIMNTLRGMSVQDFWARLREDVFDAFYSDPIGLAWIGLDAHGMRVNASGPHYRNDDEPRHR